MESHAKVLGHPLHQMLIAFPLGLLGTAVIFDLILALLGRLLLPWTRRNRRQRATTRVDPELEVVGAA